MPLPDPESGLPAVVTGASSGIGASLASDLAARGYNLVVVARREDRLQAVADKLRQEHDVQVEVRPCDLLDRDAREAFAQELAERDVGILCNNAGFVTFGAVAKSDRQHLNDEVELNALAVQDLTIAVLHGMLERGSGGLLATGSVAGHQPMPGMATYSATKAFVNTFYQALHQEVKRQGVNCTVLAPGPVRTEITTAAGKEELEDLGPGIMWMEAERVAHEAINGLRDNRRIVTPGIVAKLSKLSGQLTPRSVLLPSVKTSTDRIS